MKTTLTAAAMALAALAASPATAQVNGATVKESAEPPFKLSKITQFDYPWKIAFLPDGRMLVTEKPGKLWIATQKGQKVQVKGVPKVEYEGQGGLLGVYLSPTFDKDRGVYLTYSEPGDGGSSLALARATLSEDETPC